MIEYYKKHLKELQAAGLAFAKASPQLAHFLDPKALPHTDLFIERLCQAFAFWSATLQQRLDHDFPRLCENVLQQLSPVLLQALPASAVVQIKADPFEEAVTVYPDQCLQLSVPGRDFQFHLTESVTLWPLSVESTLREKGQLDLLLTATKAFHCDQGLTFWLEAPLEEALQAFNHLTQHVKQVTFQGVALAGQASIVWPCDTAFHHETDVFRAIQTYFVSPTRYLFVTIKLPSFSLAVGESALVTIEFEPDRVTAFEATLLLQCGVVENAFFEDAQPCVMQAENTAFHLAIDSDARHTQAILSVADIVGIDRLTRVRQPYSPLNTLTQDYAYGVYQEGNKHTLQLHAPDKQAHLLSVRLLCCDTNLNSQDLNQAVWQCLNDRSLGLTLRSALTPYLPRAPLKHAEHILSEALQWQYHGLHDVDKIHKLLTQLNVTGDPRIQHNIMGIKAIQIVESQHFSRGCLHKTITVTVSLQENHFAHQAAASLLGGFLHGLFKHMAHYPVQLVTLLTFNISQDVFRYEN